MSDRSWRVQARNTAADSENKIHDDRVAAAYGFRGGLVPGVTVYGYMVPAMIHALGRAWLERGTVQVRFHAPIYEDEWVVTRYVHEGDRVKVTAERDDGTVCAAATAALEGAGEFTEYRDCPAPSHDDRPKASAESLAPGTPLGSMTSVLQITGAEAAPEALLWMANQILVQNFRLNPWIHTESHVRHFNTADPGETVTVRGVMTDAFERKGRTFAVAALAMSGREGRPLAQVRHTFIYGLKPNAQLQH